MKLSKDEMWEVIFQDSESVTDTHVAYFLIDHAGFCSDLVLHLIREIEMRGQATVFCGTRTDCLRLGRLAKEKQIPFELRSI